MVEAKGTGQAKTTAPAKPQDKEKSKAASKSVAALAGRKRTQKKDNTPIVYAAMAIFAVLMIAIFFFALKKKPGAPGSMKPAAKEVTRKARKAAVEATEAVASGRKKRRAPAAAAAAAPAPKRTPRTAGLRSRQPVASRTERVRTPKVRRERTTGTRRSGSKRSATADELTAIGEGTAMFGKRSVRVGDVIRGRVIREITPEGVKLEYAGAIFSVRIGEAIP